MYQNAQMITQIPHDLNKMKIIVDDSLHFKVEVL